VAKDDVSPGCYSERGATGSTALSPKHQAFVDEYMKDRNATQAAIRADYSEKTAPQIGSRLLTNVDMAAEIARRTEEYTKTASISVHRLQRTWPPKKARFWG
jgi:phage terminase small subunit